MALKDKERKVLSLLKGYGSAAVAYSGGTDSTLLAVLAERTLGAGHLALTAASPILAAEELSRAKGLADRLGLKHAVVATHQMDDPSFKANQADRCYHCKHRLFEALGAEAQRRGIETMLEGSNADDEGDRRPGRRAAREWGVKSPLAEAGLTKADVRRISKRLGLPNWGKPADACLATRVPYGTRITPGILDRVRVAEAALAGMGFKAFRVRHHGDIARLELRPQDMAMAFRRRRLVAKRIKAAGYSFAALDLAGYQMGCFDARESQPLHARAR